MKLTQQISAALLGPMLILGLAVTTATAADKKDTMASDDAKAKQAYAIGVQAHIWGYPMVVMQRSRDAMTKGGDAPATSDQIQATAGTNH